MKRLAVFVILCCGLAAAAPPEDTYPAQRERMVKEALVDAGIKDPRVLDAMRTTPRHEFVSSDQRRLAYFDMALPIGNQQTISSPFIVAFMTESLNPEPADKVLEIGTGSGYQAAVLSPLVKDVYTIEIVEPLGKHATRTLARLGYENVHVKIGDGFQGWPEHAPFDKIIVTCSPEKVPGPLNEQLKEGGVMVIPVGERYQQTLTIMRKVNGELKVESQRPTLFVPMTGRAESTRQVQPDPRNPKINNGDFEQPPDEQGFVTGWYYQRQTSWETGEDAPEGEHYVRIHNEEPGRAAHLLQGFPIDGRRIKFIELSASIKCNNVSIGRNREEQPLVAITFYDENRRDLGLRWIGPFRGTLPWHEKRELIRVPPQAREALLRIGLFGATGEIWFDALHLQGRE